MDFSPIARFALLLVRPGMIVAVSPAIGGAYIPVPVKIGLTVLIAVGLVPGVPVPDVAGNLTLTGVVAREAAIGLSLAFVLRVLVGAAELAGHLSGFQIGFSYGATVDPQSGVSNTMLATLYGALATLGIFAVNGHHMILRALTASYASIPIGGGAIGATLPDAVREMLGMLFVVGTRLAAPIIIVLLVVELIVGLIARSSPSLSFMVIGYPIRIVVGLLVVAALIGVVPSVITSMLEQTVALSARLALAFR